MSKPKHNPEQHRVGRIGWLRAAVLGANDGIVSTASLIVGFAAANAANKDIFFAGAAGLVAGAMSMAAGEYISVSSQSDTERADLAQERHELETDSVNELQELTEIYIHRGLQPPLAREVAVQLTAHDALGAHARDELGLSAHHTARPLQAAGTSALTFALGALLPLLVVLLVSGRALIPAVAGSSLVFLAILGALAARAGGAHQLTGAVRVTFWSALAMAATAAVGAWLGKPV